MRKFTIKRALTATVLAISMFALAGCNKKYEVDFGYNSSDYITELGTYKGVEYEAADSTITDLDVLAYIEEERVLYTEWKIFDDRRVAEGDKVIVNVSAYLDGLPVDEFTMEDVETVIGSGTLLPDFEGLEKKVIGLLPGGMGSASKFDYKIPEDFEDEEFAGETLSFVLSVAEAYEGTLPTFNDAFVYTVSNGEYTNVEDYKAAAKRVLQENAEKEAYATNYATIIDIIIANTKFSSYPEAELNTKIENFEETMGMYATLLNTTAEEYCKDNFGMTIREYAIKNLQMQLVLQEIAKKENIVIDHKYYKDNLERVAIEAGYTTGKELVDRYKKDYVIKVMLMEKVEKLIYESAVAKSK